MTDTPEQFSRRWNAGETAVVRYLTRDGRPGMTWPFTVVEDREDLLALYIPKGALYKRFRRLPSEEARERGSTRVLDDEVWRRDVLRLMYPGAHHSIWLFWEYEDGERRHTTYYVNMEEPYRRTGIGFDTNDHMLDIVVTPDLEWRWKDADELAERVQQGVYPADFADSIRAEGERVIEKIERRESPFGDGWPEWKPDPNWQTPVLPLEWDQEPPVLWDRRVWAYGDIARGT
jgi:hypothetical protein